MSMKPAARLAVTLAWIGLAAAGLSAAPTTGPATAPAGDVARWVEDLADGNPAVREEARSRLFGLNRADLPALRKAAQDNQPLLSSQRATLHEVVTQLFLAGESYEGTGRAFLGVTITQDPNRAIGAMVLHRLSGFPAYRVLQDDDVILRVDSQDVEPPADQTFREVVSRHRPGETVRLRVVRNGGVVNIAVTLAELPADIADYNGPGEPPMIKTRDADAEQYWQEQFAPQAGGHGGGAN